MGYKLTTTEQQLRFIATFNTNNKTKQPVKNKKTLKAPRKQSQIGTPSYSRALRRAFQRAKLIVYFNPDMTSFITLTYAQADNTYQQVINDIKYLIKQTKRRSPEIPIKYIYVMEYQKRGSIHVHMIANDSFATTKNKNGYLELSDWDKTSKGFSSVLKITDFDGNFRPYLYLFKYMSKAQRIGKSFIHTSRGLAKIVEIPYNANITSLEQEHKLLFEEQITYEIKHTEQYIFKQYFEKTLQSNNN